MPWMLFLYFPRGLMSDLTTLYQSSFIPSFIEHTYVEQLLWVGIVLDSKNIDVRTQDTMLFVGNQVVKEEKSRGN